jgi:hypothetical protein
MPAKAGIVRVISLAMRTLHGGIPIVLYTNLSIINTGVNPEKLLKIFPESTMKEKDRIADSGKIYSLGGELGKELSRKISVPDACLFARLPGSPRYSGFCLLSAAGSSPFSRGRSTNE